MRWTPSLGHDRGSIKIGPPSWTIRQNSDSDFREDLRPWSPTSVHNILRNEAYTGTLVWDHRRMVAKSGQFFYYVCDSARRKGRSVCNTPLLPKQKLETFVVQRIKENILTRQNLGQLVRLANEELLQGMQESEGRLGLLKSQIADLESRLGKLCDGLETGAFQVAQLAPRISALPKRKEELEELMFETKDKLRQQVPELADPKVIDAYVNDLKGLLDEWSIMEQKAFLMSFVKAIEVGKTDLRLLYTIPIAIGSQSTDVTEEVRVLPFMQTGSPGRIRTYDLAVNSRPLYR